MRTAELLGRPRERRAVPRLPELSGGLDLTPRLLRERGATAWGDLLSNADYWLTFELARFEPWLDACAAPLRELGVGVALRWGERVDGRLGREELVRARVDAEAVVDEALRAALTGALDTLSRAVDALEGVPAQVARGLAPYQAAAALTVQSLRAGGAATIHVELDGEPATTARAPSTSAPARLPLGAPIRLAASDERGRPLPPPEVESETQAPIWARVDGDRREIWLVSPGRVRLRVPGRVDGVRAFLVR